MIRALLGSSAALALVGLSTPAQAVDDDVGLPGFCADDDAVTVVVDFQRLGGDAIVRCAPGSQPRSGLEALKAAGFQVDGVQRWGEAFICRIEDRPSAAEELPLASNEGYREACIDTPPSTGYWGYFHAENGGEWVYSGAGGKNRTVVPGGFEGWSFALNADKPPAPGIDPVRTAPGAEQQTFSGGESLPDVAAARREGSSPWPAVGGVSVAAGLGGVALLASRRRRGHDTR